MRWSPWPAVGWTFGAAAGGAAAAGAAPFSGMSFATTRPPGPEPARLSRADAAFGGDLFRQRRGLHPCARGRRGGWGRSRRGFRSAGGPPAGASAFGAGAAAAAISCLPLGKNQRDLLTDFRDASVGHINLLQHAIIKCLHFHRGLVRLDLGEDVSGFHGVALFLFPARDGSFDHRVAQLGHGDDRHTIIRGLDFRPLLADLEHFRDDTLRVGKLERFDRRRINRRRIQGGHAFHGSVEIVEGILHDDGGNLG